MHIFLHVLVSSHFYLKIGYHGLVYSHTHSLSVPGFTSMPGIILNYKLAKQICLKMDFNYFLSYFDREFKILDGSARFIVTALALVLALLHARNVE